MRVNGSVTVSSAQPALGDTVTFTAIPNTLPTGYTVAYVWKNESLNTTIVGQVATTMNFVADAYGTTCASAWSITSWTDGTNSVIGVPLTSFSSLDLVGSVCFSILQPRPVRVAPTTTTLAPTTSTPTPTTATPTTDASSALVARYVNAVPGITLTDPVVYRTAPKRVAENSAVIVLTAQQTRTLDVVSRTRAVLRTLRTKVVGDSIEQLLVGNEIVTLPPVYFNRMSALIDAKGSQRSCVSSNESIEVIWSESSVRDQQCWSKRPRDIGHI